MHCSSFTDINNREREKQRLLSELFYEEIFTYLPTRRGSSIVRIIFANPLVYFGQRHSLVLRTANCLCYEMRIAERWLGFIVQNRRTTCFWRPDQTEIHHSVLDLLTFLVVCFSVRKAIKLQQPVHLCQTVFQAVVFHPGATLTVYHFSPDFRRVLRILSATDQLLLRYAVDRVVIHGPLDRQLMIIYRRRQLLHRESLSDVKRRT